ncbi:hypothetical protein WBP_0554 [Wolbachia endosymbiont of Brugia pahangi]|nr:hypothetical protein WBP_0554 [Wolbachia endosymbiont of Brugia pahangi]
MVSQAKSKSKYALEGRERKENLRETGGSIVSIINDIKK